MIPMALSLAPQTAKRNTTALEGEGRDHDHCCLSVCRRAPPERARADTHLAEVELELFLFIFFIFFFSDTDLAEVELEL